MGRIVLAALATSCAAGPLLGQEPPKHWLHAGAMPPGAIGSQRLLRGGPLSGYIQPVEIYGPNGARISAAQGGAFTEGAPDQLLVGMLIGPVYRMKVTDIPTLEGAEVYPTIEVIDRLYPPPGQELRFPIPVQLTLDELRMASEGALVTRVIYVEDPRQALPVEEQGGQQWFEARVGDDPLNVADSLGRPVAILRIGARIPSDTDLQGFSGYGAPPVQFYAANEEVTQ